MLCRPSSQHAPCPAIYSHKQLDGNRMDDIKVLFPEEAKSGKDDGTAYQKGSVCQKLGMRNRWYLIIPNFRQVNSLNSVRETRTLMIFTKPLDQGGGDFCWASLMMNTRRNDSDSQTYLQKGAFGAGGLVYSPLAGRYRVSVQRTNAKAPPPAGRHYHGACPLEL